MTKLIVWYLMIKAYAYDAMKRADRIKYFANYIVKDGDKKIFNFKSFFRDSIVIQITLNDLLTKDFD